MKCLKYKLLLGIVLYSIGIYFVSINFTFENPLLVWLGIDVALIVIIGTIVFIRYQMLKMRMLKRMATYKQREQEPNYDNDENVQVDMFGNILN